MNRRLLRSVLAATLAIVGAFWFAIDFGNSHAAEPSAIASGPRGASTAGAVPQTPGAISRAPWLPRAALDTLLAGGAIPDPPFAVVLGVAGLYLVGRMWLTRWSMRR